MDYQSVVNYLQTRGNEVLGMNYSLEAMAVLAEALDHPERRYPSVLIAGTNGKGSVAATIAAILGECGYRTGLYTSPHLVRLEERIQIDHHEISAADFAVYGTRVIETGERLVAQGKRRTLPTYFEIVTALAFLYFAERAIDFAVLEVGLGGRLDATNIVHTECAVITSVAYDHQQWLGHALESIAAEKAGIIKSGTLAVSGCSDATVRRVVASKCREHKVPLAEVDTACRFHTVVNLGGCCQFSLTTSAGVYEPVVLNLPGRHQVRNAAVAILTAEALNQRGFAISKDGILSGIRRTQWPGRIDVRRPAAPIVLDGAHNPAAITALRDFLEENYHGQSRVMIFGAMRDKDIEEMGKIIFPTMARVILTQVDNARSETVQGLAERCASLRNDFLLAATPAAAIGLAEAIPHNVLVIAGSFYLVGETYKLFEKKNLTKA
ncbi:MAG: bifunctional folylpolyglutamate synthase/dihydrofolate synthase [Acidobacteria bacterium]|nr:bifunctional folylpolyglutamate synthase/dihydrofolate synthase [Acidobacteriota bacterium]MBI3658297.1 bifunctional folylpolyglutamate synthase/dihydrofolate synthase [Acidobacteriota bacterium]